MSVLDVALDPATVIVAVDPGKVLNRVWVSNGSGLLAEPASLPVSRDGISRLDRLLVEHDVAEPVITIEATGSLHRSWVVELERRHPGSVRMFAPSETNAARIQLGSGRFKTDDRDCAALTYLARQGAGRPHAAQSAIDTLCAAVVIAAVWCPTNASPSSGCTISSTPCAPGLSAPAGHGRALPRTHRPGWRYWPARRRSLVGDHSCDHCYAALRAG